MLHHDKLLTCVKVIFHYLLHFTRFFTNLIDYWFITDTGTSIITKSLQQIDQQKSHKI